jgi:hypothetical protein
VSKVLVVHDGKRERELLLVERLVVGRDPMCDLSHDDALLSRRHAEFAMTGDEVTVRDLGSRNGLFVNGTRAAERALRPGDIVQIGPLRVRYVTTDAAVGLAPDELDLDVTNVIPAPASRSAAAASALPVADVRVDSPPPIGVEDFEDDEEFDDDEEEEVTRVVHLPEGVEAGLAAARELDEAEATMMVTAEDIGSGVRPAPNSTPVVVNSLGTVGLPPPTPQPTLVIAPPTPSSFRGVPAPDAGSLTLVVPPPQAAASAAAAAPAAASTEIPVSTIAVDAGLTGFIFILLATLATVVFVASAAPLIMWRGDGTVIDQRSLADLLRWPVLPIIIALATTYVVAIVVNRRFTESLIAARNELLAASGDMGSPGDYRR